jgi:Carboxypeptidase regulatory-like domain
MTPTKNYLLLAILGLLASGLGYAWITQLVENPAPIEAVIPSSSREGLSVPRSELEADITAASKQISPTIKLPTVNALPPDRLVGHIVDADGKGLASVKIWLRTQRGRNSEFILRQAVTDAKGRFVLDDLDPQGVYLLFTEALTEYPGYRLDGFTLDSLPAPFEIRLARLGLADIEGTVVDAEHAPVANFTLTIDSLDTDYPSQAVTTDASGYFRLEAFPAGGLKIYTATPEYFRILGLRTRAEEYRNLTLVIDRGRYGLAGRILDERDLPVAPARITLNSVIDGSEYHSHASRTSLTDASGHFEFTGLGGIAHTLGVYANGYKPHIVHHEFQSFSDRVEIRLQN